MIRAALCGLLVAALSCAPPVAGERTTDEALAAALGEAREAEGAPGAILGIRFDDGRTEVLADGVSDLASGRPIAPTDPYFLGSISKTYTATLVLQLEREGLLALSDPLSRFVPELPRAREISIHQLVQQTSGLKDFVAYLYFRPDWQEMVESVTKHWSRAEMLELAGRFEPWFEPGERFDYSNTNYVLLGLVIERATGGDLAGELRRRVFEPLQLADSWLDEYEPAPRELVVTGYLGPVPGWDHSKRFGALGSTAMLDRGNVEFGAGGIVATAEDSLRFLAGLRAGELGDGLFSRMQEFVTTPALGAPAAGTPADLGNYYGLGIAMQERPGYRRIGHGGIYNGHSSSLWYVPECEAQIAFYANRGFIDMRRVTDRVVAALGCH